VSYSPHSSLPVEVLAWLTKRLAHLIPPRPPGVGGTRPLPLEVRLGAAPLVGLRYRVRDVFRAAGARLPHRWLHRIPA
jgi:hypothetical protein